VLFSASDELQLAPHNSRRVPEPTSSKI